MDANIYLKDSSGNPIGTPANPLVVYPATGTFDIVSPLTTKGDLLTYTTTNTRLAVATDNYVLKCNSAQPEGINWGLVAHSELTNVDGSTYHLDATGYASVNTWDVAPASKGVTNGDSHDHVGGDGAAITEDALSLSDVTTGNSSTTRHGFLPKLPNLTTQFLRGDGAWATEVVTCFGTSLDNKIARFDGTSGKIIQGSPVTIDDNGAISTPAGYGIGIGITPSYLLHIKGISTTDLPTFSDEFLDGDNWTSTGWTGSWASGWTHTTGNTNILSHDHPAISGTLYQITYTVTGRTAGTFTISFGGQTSSSISASGAWGPKATSTDVLQITPTSDFNGTIVISIKSITAASTPHTVLTNSSGITVCEIRGRNSNTNVFFGLNAGRNNTTGVNNTFIGAGAGATNTTGYSDTIIGLNAGTNNTTGYSNVFIGVTSGSANITGSDNIFVGVEAGQQNTTGNGNTGLGRSAGRNITTGSYNTFIGRTAGENSNQLATAANSMGLGYESFTTRSNQVVIGNHNVVETQLRANVYIGSTSSTSHTQPTAKLHIAAGSASANTAPLKLTSGTLLTTPEVGAIEFNNDYFYATITTGAARKGIVLNDGTALTSGKYPIATTNGRLTDGPTPLSGTKIYYVADSSGGAVTRKLTFIDGILVSET